MAYQGFFETEKNVGAKWNGWLWLDTYINQSPARTTRRLSTGSQHFIREWPVKKIYCHQEGAPEPVADSHIQEVVFDNAVTEYSGVAGYIHSFTSSSGIFTFNQNFGLHPNWVVYWNAKNTGVTPPAIGHFRIQVYKRDNSNIDTLLFTSVYQGVTSVYSASGYTMILSPAGYVTTNDRLRIRVKMFEAAPS